MASTNGWRDLTFEGKTAVVTGGSRGIVLMIACGLVQAGASVASLEVAEPELEEVFVKIMRREEAAPLPP